MSVKSRGFPNRFLFCLRDLARSESIIITVTGTLDNELSQYTRKNNTLDYYVSQGLEMASAEQFNNTLAKSIQQGNNKLIVRFDNITLIYFYRINIPITFLC